MASASTISRRYKQTNASNGSGEGGPSIRGKAVEAAVDEFINSKGTAPMGNAPAAGVTPTAGQPGSRIQKRGGEPPAPNGRGRGWHKF